MKIEVKFQIEASDLGKLQEFAESLGGSQKLSSDWHDALEAQKDKPVPGPEQKLEGGEEANPSVTVEELKKKTLAVTKKKGFRAKIKAKLKELGATSVSSLSEENYEAYNDYLDNLEQ